MQIKNKQFSQTSNARCRSNAFHSQSVKTTAIKLQLSEIFGSLGIMGVEYGENSDTSRTSRHCLIGRLK